MPFRGKSFRGKASVIQGGGPGVTPYASIAELVTASQGSLAPGYYEVLTVPTTHPQYPRVLTYWDGATFEPQISTGFENRPASDTGITYDFLEAVFRFNRVIGETFFGETSLSTQRPIVTRRLGTGTFDEYLSDALALRGGISPQYGAASGLANGSGDATIIFAGRSLGAVAATRAVAGIGGAAASQWITLCDVRSGVNQWAISFFGSDLSTGVARRGATGDVVIVHYNHAAAECRVWVNGVKFTASKTQSIPPNAPFGFGTSPFDFYPWDFEGDVQYLSISQLVIDDTAAAAWTAWLQARYSIPEL